MATSADVTFTTICDRPFAWGAFLLVASIRRSGLRCPIHAFVTDGDAETEAWLRQFDGVSIRRLDPRRNGLSPLLRKPEAMLTAETEYAAWIDSDCIVIGDISPHLIPSNGACQVRYCSEQENRFLFKIKAGDRYGPGDDGVHIPRKVLAIWRRDIGEKEETSMTTMAQADMFVLHRRHFDFVERWRDEMIRLVPDLNPAHTVHRESFAYFMADMSVFNALLAFSRRAPPVGEFQMNCDPAGFICHFGARPKPWVRWTLRNFRYFDEIASIIAWARHSGYATPSIPWHFNPAFKTLARVAAFARASVFRVADAAGRGRKMRPEA